MSLSLAPKDPAWTSGWRRMGLCDHLFDEPRRSRMVLGRALFGVT
jgi:hypothetical protein